MEDEHKDSIEANKPSHESMADPNGHNADVEKQGGPPVYEYEKERRASKHDRGDPFGDESDAEVKYRTMSWWQAAITMIAETISLGILSLPSVLGTIGMVGGVILLVGLGIIATYTGYVIGQFKLAYPHIHNMADAGEVLFAPLGMAAIGREFFGAAQIIFLIFIMGSHVLTFTIAFNTMTGHATCTIVWSIVGLIVLFIFTLPRTLKRVSYFSIGCKRRPWLLLLTIPMLRADQSAAFISIFSAVLITMIAIGIERPDPVVQATTTTGFASAFQSVTNIIFAYAGHVAFFSFISELKDPNDYPKALFFLQGWDISMYIVAAIVIYRYGGPDVSSPSLGSTAPVVQKVAYGIALPTVSFERATLRRVKDTTDSFSRSSSLALSMPTSRANLC